MTPKQLAEDFYERWKAAVISGTRADFDIVKELTKTIESAVPKKERRVWTDAKLKHIERLIEGGMSVDELALEFEVSRPRMYQVLKRYNISTPRKM